MTPSNPDNNKPFIYRIADALGITHLVVAVQHSHLMSEIEGLVSALAGKANAIGAGSPTGGIVIANTAGELLRSPKTISDLENAIAAKQNELTFDNTPTANSTNPVTSGGVKSALDNKQDTLTFDTTPTANSTNPVTSGGVKAAIQEATDVIISDIPLDMITFEKKRVYTAILTNTTGDVIKAGEYLDVSSLPSDEQNIIFNSGLIDVPDGEQFGIRFTRTDQGVYAFFDGIFAY